MTKYALFASAVMTVATLGIVAPAMAQGPFSDVPTDHWAYAAVDKLKNAGVVEGYPDKTYGGPRPMTRYEFAIAISRLLDKIPVLPPDVARQGDIDALKAQMANFATKADVDALRRLIDEFRPELERLGQDVKALDAKVNALDKRVTAIEMELKRVQIGGDINFYTRGNYRSDKNRNTFLDQSGFQASSPTNRALGGDIRVLHDLDLNIKARLSDTATAEAVINYGNYLPYLNGIASFSGVRTDSVFPGGPKVHQDEQFNIYKLLVDVPTKLAGFGNVGLQLGRVPLQLTPYTFKLSDNDVYFYNPKTDSGDIPVDGGKVAFKLGPIGVTGFLAKNDPIKFVSNVSGNFSNDGNYGLYAGASFSPFANQRGFKGGFQGGGANAITRPTQSSIDPANNGAMAVEQLGGARATFGVPKYGTIGATYIALAGNTGQADTLLAGTAFLNPNNRDNFNRVYVYGVDFSGAIAGIGVNASGTKTDTYSGSDKRNTKGNGEWDVNGSYTFGAFSVLGGYKEIGALFGAPGYWGRIGSWTNPTDIKGAYFDLGYGLGHGVKLDAAGQFYQGTGKDDFGGLTSDDKINNYKFGLKYGLTSVSNVDLGAEYTQYKVHDFGGGSDKPEEIFYNIGYGYSFNPNTSFKVLYQLVDYKDKNSGFDRVDGKGGVLAGQFNVKF